MEDYQIVDLYWARSEHAIRETDEKYGRLLQSISYSLLDRFRATHRQKRGGMGQILEELTECIPGGESPQEAYENRELARVINGFLEELDEEKRRMFVRRYFYSDSVDAIANRLKVSVSKVKTTLFRLRGELKRRLEEEGISL